MAFTPWPVIAASVVASFLQTPPVPKPFPKPGQPTTPTTTTTAPPPTSTTSMPSQAPASVPNRAMETSSQAPAGVPTEAMLGVSPYPTSEYLESFDAGRGQRYYLFGTNAAYAEIVGYYKNLMKNGGRTIFEAPAMQQWDLAKFNDQTMAFPPSVVVKDYSWNGSEGYLFVNGAKEKRFKTVIQIVPTPAGSIK
jgi:hypothetical protein